MERKLADIREGVLSWLKTLEVDGIGRYRLCQSSDDTIFTSCIALYILNLLGEVEHMPRERKANWIDYINSFQEAESGLYRPAEVIHADSDRNILQCTTFCLSALSILGGAPTHPIRLSSIGVENPADVRDYLQRNKCHKGAGGSGNKALFLAVLITHCMNNQQQDGLPYSQMMDTWFEFHDENQSMQSLVWGNSLSLRYIKGIQNAFHQWIVYEYHKRDIPRSQEILQRILELQSSDGSFSLMPEGTACQRYDHVHMLVYLGQLLDLNEASRAKLRNALLKNASSTFATLKSDGGFSQATYKRTTLLFPLRHIAYYCSGLDVRYWYVKLRYLASIHFKKHWTIETGWTRYNRNWIESNLWDTWFKCQTLYETETYINNEPTAYRPIPFIGLGYFDPPGTGAGQR